MLSGLLILIDSGAQIFGDADLEKLLALVEQLLPQLREGAEQQRKQRLQRILAELNPAELEKLLSKES